MDGRTNGTRWLYHRVLHPKDGAGMANSGLILVHTVCPKTEDHYGILQMHGECPPTLSCML